MEDNEKKKKEGRTPKGLPTDSENLGESEVEERRNKDERGYLTSRKIRLRYIREVKEEDEREGGI